MKTILEKHGINYLSTNSDKKAAVVERFSRTLKCQRDIQDYQWINVLDQLVENYNNTKHSKKTNENEMWTTLFGHRFAESPLVKIKVGDTSEYPIINRLLQKDIQSKLYREAVQDSEGASRRP